MSMKHFIFELFSEEGNISSMRVMAMIALFAAIGLAFTGHDSSALVFVTSAFSGKVVQRAVENNGNKSSTTADIK
jgi:hypothetical protein